MVTKTVSWLNRGTIVVRAANPHRQMEEHIFLAGVWPRPRVVVSQV